MTQPSKLFDMSELGRAAARHRSHWRIEYGFADATMLQTVFIPHKYRPGRCNAAIVVDNIGSGQCFLPLSLILKMMLHTCAYTHDVCLEGKLAMHKHGVIDVNLQRTIVFCASAKRYSLSTVSQWLRKAEQPWIPSTPLKPTLNPLGNVNALNVAAKPR